MSLLKGTLPYSVFLYYFFRVGIRTTTNPSPEIIFNNSIWKGLISPFFHDMLCSEKNVVPYV